MSKKGQEFRKKEITIEFVRRKIKVLLKQKKVTFTSDKNNAIIKLYCEKSLVFVHEVTIKNICNKR